MRHNEIRGTFASVVEVCYDVEIELKLQPLEGESFVHKTTTTEDEARLDIEANVLWDSRFCRTFFELQALLRSFVLSQRLQSDTPPTSNRRVIYLCYSIVHEGELS